MSGDSWCYGLSNATTCFFLSQWGSALNDSAALTCQPSPLYDPVLEASYGDYEKLVYMTLFGASVSNCSVFAAEVLANLDAFSAYTGAPCVLM